MSGTSGLAVAICTYNNAESLRLVLDTIVAQTVQPAEVLVVDNNSTDHTREVVESFRRDLAGLRCVPEPEQGLTPARVRAARELSAVGWIAYVDDDCLLAHDWVERAAEAIVRYPAAGAIGGRVELAPVGDAPVWLERFGWAFAEQDRGGRELWVDGLAGGGMVVRRDALVACGWLDEPLLADRIGDDVTSGGDVELALRLAGQGGLLYTPTLHLLHRLPAHRWELPYARRLVRGLGASSFLAATLGDRRSPASWSIRSAVAGSKPLLDAAARLALATARRRRLADHELRLAFATGWFTGWWSFLRAGRRRRRALHGALGAAGGVS